MTNVSTGIKTRIIIDAESALSRRSWIYGYDLRDREQIKCKRCGQAIRYGSSIDVDTNNAEVWHRRCPQP